MRGTRKSKNKFSLGDNFSVSVDDGHPLDIKIAEILEEKNIEAIFYIAIKNREGRPNLSKKDIVSLSKHFEIGGHAFNHVDLTKIPPKEAEKEIIVGKKALEDVLGRRIYSFCPPKGRYNKEVLKMVRKAGFTDCRTGRIVYFGKSDRSNFLWHPNLHLYPHRLTTDLIHCLKHFDYYSFRKRVRYLNRKHLELVEEFRKAKKHFHLWLHSWEVEERGLWPFLESL